MKTLVVILAQTRAHELTFNNIKANLIDVLDADVCVCIGVDKTYDTSNPFYQMAKYRFTYDEPEEYGALFEEAYKEIVAKEVCEQPQIHWREYLKLKDQFMGGVKDAHHQHPGSAGILIYARWFLLKCLKQHGLLDVYDRFVITRSDYIYELPHPSLSLLHASYIWIPDEEMYGGFTDRHVVLSKNQVVPYLNIFTNMVTKSQTFFTTMIKYNAWNLEQLIYFNLMSQNLIERVRFFPYVMYTVRGVNGATRWASGKYSPHHGYFIKYVSEYMKAHYYKNMFVTHGYTDASAFYKKILYEGSA